jgi:hypothetical protein
MNMHANPRSSNYTAHVAVFGMVRAFLLTLTKASTSNQVYLLSYSATNTSLMFTSSLAVVLPLPVCSA